MKKLELNSWWPALIENKDKYSLRELGEMFGVSAGAINTALKRNGISRLSARPGPRERKPSWGGGGAATGRGARAVSERRVHPWADKLGVMPDSEIASLSGLSAATVARIRRSRGIRAVGARGAHTAPKIDDRLHQTDAAPDSRIGWKVTIDGGDAFVVCAINMENASALAVAHSTRVTSIEKIGLVFI